MAFPSTTSDPTCGTSLVQCPRLTNGAIFIPRILPLTARSGSHQEPTVASHPARRLALVLLVTVIASALTSPPLQATCTVFGGFAIFQCGDLAYFSPPPDYDPNVYTFDPNDTFGPGGIVKNISAAFWQVGFGNQLINNGQGTGGTGMAGITTFNGNDSGLFQVDLRDVRTSTRISAVPEGAVCLSS